MNRPNDAVPGAPAPSANRPIRIAEHAAADAARQYHAHARVLIARGTLDAATQILEKVIDLQPNNYAAVCDLGLISLQRGFLTQAEAHFQKAISIDPSNPIASNNLGVTLLQRGLTAAAEAAFRRSLGVKPDLIEALIGVSRCLNCQGRFFEAEPILRKATAQDPDNIEAMYAMSITLVSTGRSAEAEEYQKRILSIDPNHVGALLLMGDSASANGDFRAAEEYYRRALIQDPKNAPALGALVGIRRMTSADDHWLKSAEVLLQGGLSASDESQLRFAMTKYFDDLGDYSSAFDNAQRANRLAKELLPAPFNMSAMTHAVDRIIGTYDKARLHRRHDGCSESSVPVLIVGMPRSGTTLIEQIIASHPKAYGAGELTYWERASASLSNVAGEVRFSHEILRQLADGYLALLSGLSTDAARIVDKMPVNFAYCGLIHSVFPNARFIHAQRHPVDTCLSIFLQKFTASHPYANDLNDLAHYYREYCRLVSHWRSAIPKDKWLDVPYEALVESQEEWSRRMIGFIGLDWDARCLEFFNANRRVPTASKWQVRQPIYKTSVARWKHYEKFIGPLLDLADCP